MVTLENMNPPFERDVCLCSSEEHRSQCVLGAWRFCMWETAQSPPLPGSFHGIRGESTDSEWKVSLGIIKEAFIKKPRIMTASRLKLGICLHMFLSAVKIKTSYHKIWFWNQIQKEIHKSVLCRLLIQRIFFCCSQQYFVCLIRNKSQLEINQLFTRFSYTPP